MRAMKWIVLAGTLLALGGIILFPPVQEWREEYQRAIPEGYQYLGYLYMTPAVSIDIPRLIYQVMLLFSVAGCALWATGTRLTTRQIFVGVAALTAIVAAIIYPPVEVWADGSSPVFVGYSSIGRCRYDAGYPVSLGVLSLEIGIVLLLAVAAIQGMRRVIR